MTLGAAIVYNHDTFRREVLSVSSTAGPRPGERAPDLDLPTTEPDGRFRLSASRRRRPVLVTFGALTCPYTLGALDALRELHAAFSGRIEFVTVYVREMHPGERRPQPRLDHEKASHARDWKHLDAIPWTVAVDRIDGEVHRAYGLLPAPAFLVDSRGRIAFRCVWAGERRALRRAMEHVLTTEGFGEDPIVVGERCRSPLSFVRGALELEKALARGGARARAAYREANRGPTACLARLVARLDDLFTRPHRRAG